MPRALLSLVLFTFVTGFASRESYDELRLVFARQRREYLVFEQIDLSSLRETIGQNITTEIIPRWFGVPWTMAIVDDGLAPNASYPGEPGKGISCSFFVSRILRDAGFKLSVSGFAGGTSKSYAEAFHEKRKRFRGSLADIATELEALPNDIYVIGIGNHIGFLHVQDGKATFLHADYVSGKVRSENVRTSAAMASSAKRFTFSVIPLTSERNLRKWLRGHRFRYRKLLL